MFDINTVSGSRFYIGTTLVADSLAEFQGDTYIEVSKVESIGDQGDERAVTEFASIADERVDKAVGTINGGTQAVTVADVPDDEGQIAMSAAAAGKVAYNFKVVLADAPAGGTPSERYYRGLVTSDKMVIGTANNIVKRTYNVAVKTATFGGPAAA